MASITAKPLAYSYIRMSTDIQLRGDSLRRQEQSSRAYAEQHGLQLVEDFKLEDIGVSAFKGANVSSGALGRFLDRVKSGSIPKGSFLLVESLDRISRQQIMDAVPVFFDIVKNGINLVTLVDNHVYRAGDTSLADVIYSIVVLGRAYEESKTKSVRIGSAWENKRKNAAHRKLTRVAPAWLSLREDRLSFDLVPERVEIVRQIFKMADAGHGSFTIARRLNQSNEPTFTKSNGWYESYITKILNNRAVLGEFQPHRYDERGDRLPHGDPVPGYFPQIISEDQFLRIRAARRKRLVEGAGRKGPEYRNLFTKIAKCEYCGSPMRFIHKGYPPKGTQTLKCTNSIRKLACDSSGWKYSDFEASFLYFVKEIDLTATLKAAAADSEKVSLEQQIAAVDEKIHELKAKRDKIFELLTEPGSSTGYVKEKLDECEIQIEDQNGNRSHLQEQIDSVAAIPTITAGELLEMIEAIQDLSAPDIYERRAAVANRLRSVVTSLTIAADGTRKKFDKVVKFLEDEQLDPFERDKLLEFIKQSNADAQRYNRSFTVVLADGVSRRIVLNNDDPTDFVAEVHLDKEGKITGTDRGMPIPVDTTFENAFKN